MKKTLLIAAAVSGTFAMTAAHAQSSVTLYGTLDAGLVFANNEGGHQNWQQSSGALTDSVFGLRGNEDLGGGLHAVFRLESAINVNNGATFYNNSLFGRQAYVGLSSDQYGTITLGRQFDSMVDYLSPLAMTGVDGLDGGNNLAAHPFDNDNLGSTFSINNAVKYTSLDYNGLQFGGLYGFSNQAGGFGNNRAYSLGASYKNGPLNFAAGYMELNNAPGGNTTGAVAQGTTNSAITASTHREFGAGLNYAFGPATVGFVWTHTQLEDISNVTLDGESQAVAGGTNLRLDNFELNGRYALTPALSLNGAYTFTDGHETGTANSSSPKWQQGTLEADYSLSKRTDVYVEGVYQHVNGGSGAFANAAINTLTPSSTDTQVAATVGLRTRF
ncbi:porin [Pararobbsia alpina]|uniref:Outer membrane porin protein n=1 Tax=Pararobbsia alpina TaxID=621374 RepID=A0A6S7B9R2_9BURK|nr:porin [Pararobbsia alpina]CAB3792891.1 Outer membrane porin protein [Pararobbsia alpina]